MDFTIHVDSCQGNRNKFYTWKNFVKVLHFLVEENNK